MNQQSLFSVDLHLLLATLACFFWGFGYGWWIHKTKTGQIFEREFTWMATALGITVDLFLLAVITGVIPWEFISVLVASAIGIIIMALIYGYPVVDNGSFRPKWLLEDGVAISLKCYETTLDLLKYDLPQEARDDIKRLLSIQDSLREKLREARKSIIKKKSHLTQ